MAEYLLVDSARHLVPLGDLDPVQNVSLTDAGLTPYHAIKKALRNLGAGSTAVVIGTGGLGHIGIQILRAITGATVIALDVNDEKLELARASGAHHAILSNDDAPAAIKRLTSGQGASAVFDFVGAAPTVRIAAASAATEADVMIVGIGGGELPVGFGSTAFDVSVRAPYWGSRSELVEVLELARRGQVNVEVETFRLDEAPRAYELLHEGKNPRPCRGRPRYVEPRTSATTPNQGGANDHLQGWLLRRKPGESLNQSHAVQGAASVGPVRVGRSTRSQWGPPAYSYDYDEDYPPEGRALKDAIAASDAILFVTPEYNRAIPGGLKNASTGRADRGDKTLSRASPPRSSGRLRVPSARPSRNKT